MTTTLLKSSVLVNVRNSFDTLAHNPVHASIERNTAGQLNLSVSLDIINLVWSPTVESVYELIVNLSYDRIHTIND